MKCPHLIDRTIDIKKSKSSTGQYEHILIDNIYEFKECLKFDCPFYRFIEYLNIHGESKKREECLRR